MITVTQTNHRRRATTRFTMKSCSRNVLLLAFLLAVALTACAPLTSQHSMTIRQEWSPNFDDRRPSLVVIHHTTNDSLEEALTTLTSPERRVSAHYLIGRDGQIVQLVDEKERAWHAGKSWWGGNTDVNSLSIGIELDNNGDEPFTDVQIEALLFVLAGIQQRYSIPAANFVGHADVAPTRKSDPSRFFPWARLAAQGFGLWCDMPVLPAPAGFDLSMALTALGYDPATPDASLSAFRLHFVRSDHVLSSEEEAALAYCLVNERSVAGRGLFPPS